MAATDQSVSGVSGRYARALFDLAQESNSVAETARALSAFQAIVDESDDLQRLMRSPVFKAEDQLAAITSVAGKAGVNGVALNFLKVMSANRRLSAVPEAITGFHALVAQSKGETTAEVTSAEKLSAKQLADLKAALKATVGKDVMLESKVDPSILGGLVVKLGSRMMDNSLRTKLNSLKAAMKGNA